MRLPLESLEAARLNPFGANVLGDTFVVCLECGRFFKTLGGHVPKKHGMSIDDYKELYGYNRSQPLMSAALLERHVAIGKAIPRYEHVMEALAQGRRTGPQEGMPKRAQAMPRLIRRNRRQAKRVPKGQDSPLYRKDVTPERVAELRAQGLKKREIAALLQCDPRVVWQRMKEAGLNRPLYRKDVTPERVARAYASGTRSLKALQAAFHCGGNLIRKHLKTAGIIVPSQAPTSGSNPKTAGRKPRVPNRPDVTPEAVAAAHRQGMSWKAMGEHFQCSEAAIRLRLHQAGVVLKKDSPAERTDIATEDLVAARARGMSLKAICAQFQCGEALVRGRLKAAGVPQTSVRERVDIVAAEVVEAVANGRSIAELAALWECSEELLQTRLRDARRGKPRGGPPAQPRVEVAREVLQALLEQGLTRRQIAVELGLSEAMLGLRIQAYGLKRTTPVKPNYQTNVTPEQVVALRQQGLTFQAIGQALGCSTLVVQQRLREAGAGPIDHRRLDVTVERVAEGLAQGLSVEQMAEAFGCGSMTIRNRLRARRDLEAAGP